MAQDPFGDIPLFREIQRILSSSSGPVNFEIAGQIAGAVATGSGDPPLRPEAARAFDDAVHEATGVVSGYTGLVPDEPLATRLVTRAEWAHATLGAWKWLLEHVAGHIASELGRIGGEGGEGEQIQQALGGVAPLLLGIQTGTVVGHLSREILARHELPIPRDDDGRLFLVAANVTEVAADYSFDEPMLVRWLALREVVRELLVTQVPWVGGYLRSRLTDIVDAIEIDPGDLESRFVELQSRGVAAFEQGMGPDSILPIAPTERHRRALERLHAFLALFQGYADHVAAGVDDSVLGDTTIIDEGMTRHRLSPSDGKTMLAGVLGLQLDRTVEAAGKTFCAAVVELHGIPALRRVWDAPDNLPSLAEIRDPFLWIERTLPGE